MVPQHVVKWLLLPVSNDTIRTFYKLQCGLEVICRELAARIPEVGYQGFTNESAKLFFTDSDCLFLVHDLSRL